MNLKNAILIAFFVLFMVAGLSGAYCVVFAASYNVIHYWTMVEIALFPGIILLSVLYKIINKGRSYDITANQSEPPHKRYPIINWIVLVPLFLLVTTGPFYLTLLLINKHFDGSTIDYQGVRVIGKETRSIFALSPGNFYGSKPEHAPELRVSIKLPSGEKITYPVDVDQKLFDSISQNDPVVIGISNGALGFSYVASVEKAGP